MTNNEWGFITLPTHADPEQRAIARLKLSSEMSLEHYKTPLLLTHSGGKDSCVLTELALRAEIPFEVLHAHTTADAPETVHFVRSEFARLENRGIRCSINYPLYKGSVIRFTPEGNHKGDNSVSEKSQVGKTIYPRLSGKTQHCE